MTHAIIHEQSLKMILLMLRLYNESADSNFFLKKGHPIIFQGLISAYLILQRCEI